MDITLTDTLIMLQKLQNPSTLPDTLTPAPQFIFVPYIDQVYPLLIPMFGPQWLTTFSFCLGDQIIRLWSLLFFLAGSTSSLFHSFVLLFFSPFSLSASIAIIFTQPPCHVPLSSPSRLSFAAASTKLCDVRSDDGSLG
jgi:hypothetical protein